MKKFIILLILILFLLTTIPVQANANVIFSKRHCEIWNNSTNPFMFSKWGDSNFTPEVFMGHFSRIGDDEISILFKESFSEYTYPGNGGTVQQALLAYDSLSWTFGDAGIDLIALGTNFYIDEESSMNILQQYAFAMNRLVMKSLDNGRLPILFTVSGNHYEIDRFNDIIRMTAEYFDVPLVDWVDELDYLLGSDGVHYTVEGWNVRSNIGKEILQELVDTCSEKESLYLPFIRWVKINLLGKYYVRNDR